MAADIRNKKMEGCLTQKLFLKNNHTEKQADTLYPIANFTATSVNSKVYRKAPQTVFTCGDF